MKILVLGAGGFLGKTATRYLTQTYPDYKIVGNYLNHSDYLTRGNITHTYRNLLNKDDINLLLTETKPDVILQLAAVTTNIKDVAERPYIHVTDNAVMNALIFQAAHEHNVKHVLFSSCTTMYPGDKVFPLMEEDFDRTKIHPKYFGVASTKVYIEDLCKFWSSLGRTKYTVFRHSNIIGMYDRFNTKTGHVFGATCRKVADTPAGEKVKVWGTGAEERDLLHADDLMSFIDLAIHNQAEKFGLFNVGSGSRRSVKDITQLVINKLNPTCTIEYQDGPTMNFSLHLDCSRARKTLGWQPKLSIEAAIDKAIEEFKHVNSQHTNP